MAKSANKTTAKGQPKKAPSARAASRRAIRVSSQASESSTGSIPALALPGLGTVWTAILLDRRPQEKGQRDRSEVEMMENSAPSRKIPDIQDRNQRENENETVTLKKLYATKNVKIEWTVTLANRKAAGFRIFDTNGGTLGRTGNPKLRNADLDRDKLVISASENISGTGTPGPTLTGDIEFAKPNSNGLKVSGIALGRLETDGRVRKAALDWRAWQIWFSFE